MKYKHRQTLRFLILAVLVAGAVAVASFNGCAQYQSLQKVVPVTATGQDLQSAVAQATQAYIQAKNGDVSYAWSIQKGLDAYQLYLKTKGDVKAVVQQWSDGTKAGQTFAEKLAVLFGSSPAPPAAKVSAISSGVQIGAQSSSP